MIRLVIARNPFDLTTRQETLVPFVEGKKLNQYFTEPGEWVYSINGELVDDTASPTDEAYVVVLPKLEKQAFAILLSIGLSIATAGIASGAIFGITSVLGRTLAAMAIGMIGNAIISKIATPKTDSSNTEQSATYGWQGAQTIIGQGHPLAITYGKCKSAGMLISRHVTSDGEKQYLNLLYCAGEGPIDAITDVKLNGNPIGNYKEVQLDVRLGTNNQEIIPNFNDNYADQPLTYELTNDWSIHQTQGNLSTALEVTISLPNGLYYSNDQGGLSETSVTIEGGYRKVGSAEWIPLPISNNGGQSAMLEKTDNRWFKRNSHSRTSIDNSQYTGVIKDSSNKAIYRVFRFDVKEPGQYEIRMRCAHKDGNSNRHVNKVYWSQLTQIVYDDFIHPGKVLIGIKALATDQLNGNDPNVTWIQERKTVWVFNTYTGAYESKPANNPAWACYDILHHCRKIGDEYVVKGAPRERFVYDAFKAWADKCDEKHITFNYIYDNASQVWDALKYAENVGRGKVIPLGTRFSCIYDYAATPTQLFTVGNIKMDSFMEEFQATSSRANAIEVSFLNKAKDYERDVLPVFSEEYDVTTSLASPAQVELMGCVDVDQAYNYAKHYLRANKYEVRTCTFEAFTDAIACTIGDVILLQHDVTDWGQGGRVESATGNKVILDREVTFEQGKTYRLMVRNAKTDALESYNVTGVSGKTLTLASNAVIQTDDLYTYGEATKEAKPFRVLSISKSNSEMTRKISCIEYYPELYAGDDGSVPIIDYTTKSDLIKVINLVLIADVKTLKDGTVLCDINGTWQLPRDKVAKNIIVYYKPVTTKEWQQFKVLDGSATSVTIPSVATDVNYDVKIVCTNNTGAAYEGVERAVYVSGKEIPPATPKGFKVTQDAVNSSVLHLSWEPNTEADLHGYTLYDGNDVVLIKHIGGTSYSYFIPNTGSYQFKLSAVDTSGNESGKAEARITASVSAESVATPKAPARGEVKIGKTITAAWDPVENTYIDYYEVRLDSNVGQSNNLLAKTTDIRSDIKLSARRGAVFIYAHNPVKGYGPALRLDYNAAVPKAPTNVKVKGNITGISVVFDSIPDTCIGANIYIGAEKYFVTTNVNMIPHDPGVFDVKVAYVDVFGEGTYSNIIGSSVPASIDPSLINAEALGLADIDRRINELDKSSNQYAKAVQAMSHAPQLMRDPIFKSELELSLYLKDGQQVTQRFGMANAQYDDVVTGGRMVGLIPGDTKYSSIGYGGFKIKPKQQSLFGELNNTYIVRMIAKVKPSMTIHLNHNDIGKGGISGWITDNKGTDKPEEYIFYWKYGKEWQGTDKYNRECGYVYFKDKAERSTNPNFIAWIYKIEVFAVDEYDNSLDDVRSSITQLAGSIDSKVTNATSGMATRITQLDNAIKSQVITGDKVMSAITQYTGGTRIDGRLLHVTGDALFDNNIITNKMLAAKAVSADKLNVTSLSAISANLGEVTGGKIIGGTIQNKTGTFKVDANGNIVGANIAGSRIDAQSIMQAGFKIRNIDVQIYKVRHGDWCPLLEGFTESQCTFIPVGYKMTEDYSDVTGGTEKGREKWAIANGRRIDDCTIYFQSNISSEYHDTKPTIGLNGRKAVCQSLWYSAYHTRDDDGYHHHISFGELYVLVIGKK